MSNSNKSNQKQRFRIYTRDNFSCVKCGRKFDVPKDWNQTSAIHDGEMYLELDHIKPISKGGSNEIENKQAMCEKCNREKGDSYA